MAKTATKKTGMSKAHKDALAKGREEGRKVRAYLKALEQERQRSGRRMDPAQLKSRIAETQARIDEEPDPARRLELIQKRMDYEEAMAAQREEVDLARLEKDFVKAIPGYAQRKGITYSALREAGVPASVLRQAGIKRTRRTS